MAADALTTLLSATGGAFLGKFVGPAAESLGKAAWERVQQLGTKATAYLAQVGREPQPVELKLLLPLVQAASLETDPSLVDYWAALLANLADPAQRVQAQPGFADTLRQLTPVDAQVLRLLYAPAGKSPSEPVIGGFKTAILLNTLGLDYNSASLVIDNLARLQLCFATRSGSTPMPSTIGSSAFGFYFMQAVTPPTP